MWLCCLRDLGNRLLSSISHEPQRGTLANPAVIVYPEELPHLDTAGVQGCLQPLLLIIRRPLAFWCHLSTHMFQSEIWSIGEATAGQM